ncbi:MAG: PEP/pyruvate-binding domain-containing protein [Planctomycetota bacterium]|jgi:pyruvate,water dikinase
MSQAKIVPLDTARLIDEKAIGPKAASLVRLGRIGLAVPAGFCITETAFREHLEQNKLIGCLISAVDGLSKAEPPAKQSLLSELRQAIVEAPLAELVRQEIGNHYRSLESDRVVVRSSGTAEDLPGHSFAGQYDTYLGITNIEDCIKAVKKCWASLWTLRAYEYRENNGFDHLKISMAVIVQSLVVADTSGVIFTVDPLTGGRGNIVIETCFGLGEALVQGKVTPDRFIVNKKKLKLLSSKVSEKKFECILDKDGIVKEKAIPKERSLSECLDRKQVKRLAKLARKVETEFGCPQDIEWAICKNKVYLLQSRPITALPPEKSWEDRQIWCSNPAKEVIPDVVTPATSSIIEAMLDDFIDPIFRVLCMDRGDHPIYGLVAGRIYFNANIWGSVFRDLPGGRDFDGMALAGSHRGLQEVTRRLQTATDEDLPDMKFRRYRFFLKIPLIIIGMLRNTPKKGRRILTKIGAKNDQWSPLDPASLTTEEITMYCREIMAGFHELLGHVLYLFSMIAALPLLDIICNRWLPDDNINSGRLLAGVGGMVDATAGLDIWRLATVAHSKTDVKDLILSNNDWDTIEGKLSQTNSGREFLAHWNRFRLRHGHHCRGELELYNKRWSETPDYILQFIRSHMNQMGEMDPAQNFTRATEQRRQLEEQCRERLKNPIKRTIFNSILSRAQQGSVFRENVKSEVIKLLTTKRKLLLELGKRLRDKGVLENEDDTFFLRYEEIIPVVNNDADFDFHETVHVRRAEYDKNCSITPPDAVFGQFDPDTYIPETIDEQAEILKGFGVSPGTATGKARVILRADTDEQVLAGEILVAPFTDPGWTPYFVPAAAIVMDEGGMISHGSIVAREYGLPAVVNVGNATRIIKTGQTIQVDGNRGVVRILQ